MNSLAWLAAVNIVLWVGFFAYFWRLDRRTSSTERSLPPPAARS